MQKILTAAFLFFILQYSFAQTNNSFVSYVQPLTGTASSTTKSSLKHGAGTELFANTIPAVTVPFAMTQWVAQTRAKETKCEAPYYYKDSLFSGFRATHWLSGGCTQDYGSFTIMPLTGKLKTVLEKYQTRFSHSNEIAKPYYYSINLNEYKLKAELTASARCGFIKITAQTDDSLYILITPNSDYQQGTIRINKMTSEIVAENPVHRIYQGWGKSAGFSGYATILIDRKITVSGTYNTSNVYSSGSSINNQENEGVFIGFKVKKGEILNIRIGTSFTSIDGARKNLLAEIFRLNFKETMLAAKSAWENKLSLIKVEGEEKKKSIFYTALYHAMQQPRLYSDADGRYPRFAGDYKNEKIVKGNYYDDFSMWDIYRAQLPLLEIIQPTLVNNFIRSLILKSEQGGWLPNFPCWNSYTSAMVGDHAAAFIASAYNKGIRSFDISKAYYYMYKNAFTIPDTLAYIDGRGRRALSSYLKYNYYPLEDSVLGAFHKMEQVSRTIEYAYDDYSVSTIATALGKTKDAIALRDRGENFKNVFDKESGFSNGRYANGQFYKSLNPDAKMFFITEGTPRQYSFYAPQDMKGLIELFGGKNNFENQLDSIFLKNEYWHGNEPGQQIPFLYNYTNTPYKSSQRVRQLLEDEYEIGPGGLSGNDDAGQISAWYVFAATGFYPVNPVSDEYAVVSPLFDTISIKTGNGKTATISCKRESKSSLFIQSITLNGKPYNSLFLKHKELMNAAQIVFNLTDKPQPAKN